MVALIAVWLMASLVGFWLGWSLAASFVDCWLVWFLFLGLVCWSFVVCSFDWRINGSWLDSLLVAGLVALGCWLGCLVFVG